MFQLALGPCPGDKAARQVKCGTVRSREKMRKSTESLICTECLFTGAPEISFGRLVIEFLLNLIVLGNGSGIPIFDRVRHCPDCGGHSMVSIESEGGQTAITRLNKDGRDRSRPIDSGRSPAHSKLEEEIIRSRLQQ